MTRRNRPSALALILIVALSVVVLAAAFTILSSLNAPDPADAPLWAAGRIVEVIA